MMVFKVCAAGEALGSVPFLGTYYGIDWNELTTAGIGGWGLGGSWFLITKLG